MIPVKIQMKYEEAFLLDKSQLIFYTDRCVQELYLNAFDRGKVAKWLNFREQIDW